MTRAPRKFSDWRDQVLEHGDIAPVRFGMTQAELVAVFGEPDDISTMKKKGKPLIFKYGDIEFHFEARPDHSLFLIYSDEGLELELSSKPW